MAGEQIATAISKNGVPIRLTEERWQHVLDEHPEVRALHAEVLRTVTEPERVLAGSARELMALRAQADGKVLVAIYREVAEDGFLITTFLIRRVASLNRRTQLWP